MITAMKIKLLVSVFILLDVLLACYLLTSRSELILLNPAGLIAFHQRQLLTTAVFLGLLIIIPAIIIAYVTAYRFRSTNKKASYKPEWQTPVLVQIMLWVIPTMFILIMAVITWKSTHELDPTKQIAAQEKPMTIQVVALRWKWLFIYPEQQIATVNFVAFPKNTPVTFYLTADAPMSSFWIPHLAGQMYAMEGMVNRLNLIADREGVFPGSNAEISGAGFATMRFTAQAMSQTAFAKWVASVKQQKQGLTSSEYSSLSKPTEDVAPRSYSVIEQGLYNSIVMKYMAPMKKTTEPANNIIQEMDTMDH